MAMGIKTINGQSPRYYSLLVKGPGERWSIEFGDYNRNVVRQEQRDLQEGAEDGVKFRIVVSGDTQAEIDAIVAEMNAQ